MPETVRELTDATTKLADEVHSLSDRLRTSEDDRKRQGRWIRVQAGVIAALLVGGIVLWHVAVTANHATDAVQSTAIKSCLNANESRKGTLRLWLGIINAPRPQGSPTRTEAQEQQVADLRQFVEQLYQARDCNHLDRTYPLPDLPDSLKPRAE